MTIKEAEARTGLPRSVIRFYEKEGLIAPQRNAENRYRDYAPEEIERLIRVAFLRTLDIPIEEIRRIMAGELSLEDAARARCAALREEAAHMARAAAICERLAADAPPSLDALDVERYAGEPETYVKENRHVLLRDGARFARWFGTEGCRALLVLLSALLAAAAFPRMPERIAVTWGGGAATGDAPRAVLFVYPAAIAAIQPILGGRIRMLSMRCFGAYGETVSAYAVNGMGLLLLGVELFSVLTVYGVVRSADALVVGCIALVLAMLAVRLDGRFCAKMRR